jgi:hypothetical protein
MARNLVACQRTAVQLIRATLVESHELGFEGCFESDKGMPLNSQLPLRVDARQHAIYTIQRGAGHQADEVLRRGHLDKEISA